MTGTHAHPHAVDHNVGASYEGTVMLDIGGDVGALVIVAGAADMGREIEVCPVGGVTRTHVAVRERHLGSHTMYCAVYPSLPAGPYTIWRDETTPVAEVRIRGAEVAEYSWPAGV